MSARPGRARREVGGATVELTLIAPVLLVLFLFVIALGRLAQARADLDGAARDAARAASVTRDPSAARAAAATAAGATLAGRRVTCRLLRVEVDTAAFAPGGDVAVALSCEVSFGDLALLRLPGAQTLHARAVVVLDRYRGAG